MSEIQRLPPVMNPNPVHPNAKTTTQITNGTTTTKTNIGLPVCRNCKTQTTPLWRRDETGQVLCNACGLFLKLHGRPRPISLKTDTIKLRNRIKQPNFSKLLGPNTPELKLKDAKPGPPHRHRLPLLAPGKRLPQGSPLEQLRPGSYAQAPYSSAVFPSQLGHFHGALPHQVQLLHYPALTPTQFAPGLQRITSPLLLLTTSLVLNARSATGAASPSSALTAMQAAGALENMSNELGPSASFKGPSAAPSHSGVSLLNSSASKVKPESPQLGTPRKTLDSSPKPPLLPALGLAHDLGEKVLASPSFGPQFALLDSHTRPASVEHPMPSLPPIHNVPGSSLPPQLPHLPSNLSSAAYSAAPTPEQRTTPVLASQQILQPTIQLTAASGAQGPVLYGAEHAYSATPGPPTKQSSSSSGTGSITNETNGAGKSDSQRSRNGQDEQEQNPHNNNNPNGNSGHSGSNSYEVNVLRTRISELELVNDLYRTRIMELEAMEQAARLRENSMRKRLDDLLRAQGYEDSLSMLNSTMRVLKREDTFKDDASKRQKTG